MDVQVPAADLGRRDVEAVHRGRLCLPVDPAAVGVLVTHTHYTTTNTNTTTPSPSPVNCVSTVYANSNNNNNNNNSHDNGYGADIMTKVSARVHPVHLMNAD